MLAILSTLGTAMRWPADPQLRAAFRRADLPPGSRIGRPKKAPERGMLPASPGIVFAFGPRRDALTGRSCPRSAF